jgi:hypothetical protein
MSLSSAQESLAMKKIIGTVLVLLHACLVHAQPVNYSCTGRVQQVTVGRAGDVNATFEFNGGGMAWQGVCSLTEGTSYGINPAACRGILAILTTANQTQKPVEMWFSNTSGNNCSAPAWRNLFEMGWYWGPSLKAQ